MARLFPLRSETPSTEGQPRVVDLEDEDADAVFGALSSTTARKIYSRLSEEPATPSDVAESIDSSIQNVRYHLEKLEDAGLIEVVDTWYSSRGNEMSVYATTDGPLIVTSDTSRAAQLREALSRYLGGVAVLGGASLFVQYGLNRVVSTVQSPSVGFGSDEGADDAVAGGNGNGNGNGNGGGNGDGAPTAADAEDEGGTDGPDGSAEQDGGVTAQSETDDEAGDDRSTAESEDLEAGADEGDYTGDVTTTDGDAGDGVSFDSAAPSDDGGAASTAPDYGAEATDFVASLPPGLLFFLGGLLVLTVVTVWWYRSSSYHR